MLKNHKNRMKLSKFSIGTGDRFDQQGKALLQAVIKAKEDGVEIAIIWNKSHREHSIVKTKPEDVFNEAQNAVKELNWKGQYYIDADHIGLSNVDLFMDHSNFFTLDVAEYIGEKATNEEINSFIEKHKTYVGELKIPKIDEPLYISEEQIRLSAVKYLLAVKKAGEIYRKIEEKKEQKDFVIEVSMDETNDPQTPLEIFFILAAIAEEKIPIQTIAPKFTGRFNKGIDYEGNIEQFAKEFEEDLAMIKHAITEFSLPDNLKLSIHSGSDKFSLYDLINKAIKKYDSGLHLKTAGTTWLEELIGLAMAGDDGLRIVKEIYEKAHVRYDELCEPYATVIDIDRDNLPSPEIVNSWTSEDFVRALRHDVTCKHFDPNFRQLLHVAYKIAAEMGERYLNALIKHERTIAENVTFNMYERHLKRLFY